MMKAVQIKEFGSAEVLQYTTIEQPQPQAGEILIKVEAASVNYSDTSRRANASYPFPTPLPFIPGSEVAGTVAALGEGVIEPSIGTPVFALVGNGASGYAQYAVTPATQVIPMPPTVTSEQAAAIPVAGTSAVLIMREVAKLQQGETILIQGAAGGVGSYAVQIAKILGARQIIGATSSSAKFDSILANGADAVVDYSQPDWGQQVRKLTDGRGADVILEMRGGDGFIQNIQCLAPFGRIVVYGMASRQPLVFDEQSITQFFYDPSLNQSIHVFNLGLFFGMKPEVAGEAMGDLIGLVASGQINVQVDTVLPLSYAAEAHRMMEAGQTTGKIVLKPWDDA